MKIFLKLATLQDLHHCPYQSVSRLILGSLQISMVEKLTRTELKLNKWVIRINLSTDF